MVEAPKVGTWASYSYSRQTKLRLIINSVLFFFLVSLSHKGNSSYLIWYVLIEKKASYLCYEFCLLKNNVFRGYKIFF